MARPQKAGLDYFPLDVDIDQDDKVAIIEAQHGILGFGIVIKLLMKIYDNGYFYEWTEKEQILFSNRVNADINEVNVIINDCVKWGLFNKGLFDKYKILTSRGVQIRYLEAIKRRKEVALISEYLLIDSEELKKCKNIVIVNINEVNADINVESVDVNADINSQSKVKYSKVKKSKEYIKSDSENPTEPVEPKKDNKSDVKPLNSQEAIFEYWNGKGIIQHRRMTDRIKRSINGALRDYTEEEICTAIDNYKTILFDDKYYWSYKWGLREFLQRGIDKFLDFDIAAQNYAKKTDARDSPIPANIKNALALVKNTEQEDVWEVG